jgi:hypothetical protein
VTSYAGDLCLSVNADRDVVRDAGPLLDGVERELGALGAVVAG